MHESPLERSLAPISRNFEATVTPDPGRRAGGRVAGGRPGGGRLLREAVFVLVIAILASFVIKTTVVRTFWVPSESMSPTLLVDDRIVVNQLWSTGAAMERGAIIVFRDPGDWLDPSTSTSTEVTNTATYTATNTSTATNTTTGTTSNPGLPAVLEEGQFLVKRVIGVPGDQIECCGESRRLIVNGVELVEDYLAHDGQAPPVASEIPFDVTVPDGSLWVMGDNRANSADSRAHRDGPTGGFVPIDDVVGTAFAIVAPASRWRWLGS